MTSPTPEAPGEWRVEEYNGHGMLVKGTVIDNASFGGIEMAAHRLNGLEARLREVTAARAAAEARIKAQEQELELLRMVIASFKAAVHGHFNHEGGAEDCNEGVCEVIASGVMAK